MTLIQTEKTSFSLPIASVILGIIGLSPVAIVCGHLAFYRIKRNEYKNTSTSKRMAYGGLISGYFGMIVWIYMFIVLCAMVFKWDISFLFPFGIDSH